MPSGLCLECHEEVGMQIVRARTQLVVISFGLWIAMSNQSLGGGSGQAREADGSCFKHHGRLSSQNGTALMIWLIGTTRVVALENSELPPAVEKYLDMASLSYRHTTLRRRAWPTLNHLNASEY